MVSYIKAVDYTLNGEETNPGNYDYVMVMWIPRGNTFDDRLSMDNANLLVHSYMFQATRTFLTCHYLSEIEHKIHTPPFLLG